MLKILLGELSPTKGIRHAHRSLRIGYFSQHHVDQLEMELNSIELLQQRFPGEFVLIFSHLLPPLRKRFFLCPPTLKGVHLDLAMSFCDKGGGINVL